jgi:hypothetical protein
MIVLILRIFMLVLAGLALCYLGWRWMMAGDVARIEQSIQYHDHAMQSPARAAEFKANAVYATGFPFQSRVRVERPRLSYIAGEETYSVAFDYVDFEPRDTAQGSYNVTYSTPAHALYAKSGQAPEIYTVTADATIGIILRAQGNSQECSGFPGGKRCPDVVASAPLISAALQLPSSVTLTMTLNGASRQASFPLVKMDVPIFQTIPADMFAPLELFIGVLREAMVFQTPQP